VLYNEKLSALERIQTKLDNKNRSFEIDNRLFYIALCSSFVKCSRNLSKKISFSPFKICQDFDKEAQ
jgi:hypothetical protein